MASSLSVVSAPAPVMHRPELAVPPGVSGRQPLPAAPQQTAVPGLRSTKSQRIRGASNNLRMKQLSVRDSGHAGIVFT